MFFFFGMFPLEILEEPGGTYGEVDGPTLRNQADDFLG